MPVPQLNDDESPFRPREPLATARAVELLLQGEIEILGRMPWSSNGTFLVDIVGPDGAEPIQGIYKPGRGERPLWDFPDGLYSREVAAFALSEHLGWNLVPPTVLRDGPLGEGSLQLFIPADFEQHYFTLQDDPAHRHTFQRLCAFDIVANNTDRKSGHCLLGEDGQIWAIDNGLAFHAEFKLRTVIWEFGDEDIPADIAEDLQTLLDNDLAPSLVALLNPFEREALRARARSLLLNGVYPIDPTGRRHPWPLV